MREAVKDAVAAVAIAVIAVVLVGGFSGCNAWKDDRGRGDAPIGKVNDSPRDVWNGPDKFHNVAAWCIGEDGLYSTTRQQSPPVVVPNDPNCDEGGILK